MIKVLIVDDDPMVAEFNKRYLQEIEGFSLVDVVHSVKDALTCLQQNKVDLLLLDIYMPKQTGLSLLRQIREEEQKIDAILITAASDVERIQEALRYGAVDYLIKPFEFERFQQALQKYKETFEHLNKREKISQQDLDQLLLLSEENKAQENGVKPLPKGLSKKTLKTVIEAVKEQGKKPFSTEEIADRTDISRVSVRKYLKFLSDIYVIDETLTYGIGRPLHSYLLNSKNQHILKDYV